VTGPVIGPEKGIVDHTGIARRLRRWLVLLLAATLLAWLIGGLVGDGPTLSGLMGLLGVAVLLALLVEVVVVGGAAVAGALRAGERGDRLAAPDVTLLPPQLAARLRRPRAPGAHGARPRAPRDR
jgi:cation transporter-like permease